MGRRSESKERLARVWMVIHSVGNYGEPPKRNSESLRRDQNYGLVDTSNDSAKKRLKGQSSMGEIEPRKD